MTSEDEWTVQAVGHVSPALLMASPLPVNGGALPVPHRAVAQP